MNTERYTVALDEAAQVPMTAEQIRNAYHARRMALKTPIWREGLEDWSTLEELADELGITLMKAKPPRRAPAPVQRMQAQRVMAGGGAPIHVDAHGQQYILVKTQKSRGVYVALALLLGPLGVHNFYAGYSGTGAAMLLFTLLLGWTGVVLVVIWIINIAECFTTTTDSSGLRLG